jgi:hypothetical protein
MSFCNNSCPCGKDCTRQDDHGGDCVCSLDGCPRRLPVTPATPWSVTVKKSGSTHRTLFTVGNQTFTVAQVEVDPEFNEDHGDARHHCQFIKNQFLVALNKLGLQPTSKKKS